jgi:abhydrolase domain-containing protein 17
MSSNIASNLITILQTLAVCYVIIWVSFLVLSNPIMYQAPPTTYEDGDKVIKLKTSNGKTISAYYLPNESAKYTIIYSHGNAEDLGLVAPLLESYQSHGFNVIGYDYQGYGTSEGRPSEKNTYADIEAVYKYLTQELNTKPENIIIHGRSLGGGPSVELAAKYPNGGLIIESSFTTAFRVMTYIPLFLFDKYKNIKKLDKINSPILIIHGKKDEVIPFYHGKKLFNKAKSLNKNVLFYTPESAGHNDLVLVSGQEYWNKIIEFTNSL